MRADGVDLAGQCGPLVVELLLGVLIPVTSDEWRVTSIEAASGTVEAQR
ncbi:hypothetical protein [Candidatus Viridilinea mediisalina]|nr:hypothetical protein [Candidatus Viridilinea mediisalina]